MLRTGIVLATSVRLSAAEYLKNCWSEIDVTW